MNIQKETYEIREKLAIIEQTLDSLPNNPHSDILAQRLMDEADSLEKVLLERFKQIDPEGLKQYLGQIK